MMQACLDCSAYCKGFRFYEKNIRFRIFQSKRQCIFLLLSSILFSQYQGCEIGFLIYFLKCNGPLAFQFINWCYSSCLAWLIVLMLHTCICSSHITWHWYRLSCSTWQNISLIFFYENTLFVGCFSTDVYLFWLLSFP